MSRLRYAADVDLSTANPKCPKCRGTGICGERDVEISGKTEIVPVVCGCVCDAGGVKKDALDRHHEHVAQAVKDGTFVSKTVKAIMSMDEGARMMAIEAYERLLARPALDIEAKKVISQIVEQVENEMRKGAGGSSSVH